MIVYYFTLLSKWVATCTSYFRRCIKHNSRHTQQNMTIFITSPVWENDSAKLISFPIRIRLMFIFSLYLQGDPLDTNRKWGRVTSSICSSVGNASHSDKTVNTTKCEVLEYYFFCVLFQHCRYFQFPVVQF